MGLFFGSFYRDLKLNFQQFYLNFLKSNMATMASITASQFEFDTGFLTQFQISQSSSGRFLTFIQFSWQLAFTKFSHLLLGLLGSLLLIKLLGKGFIWIAGGQRLNPAFVSDIQKKVLSRTVEMETDQTFNEGLARLGRSGFHLLRGRNFLH
jgi:hypothetical protein